jgi:hypothetical protein
VADADSSVNNPPPLGGKGQVEHRRARRRQVLKRGQLIFGHAGSTIDCLVLDESPHGVGLETPLMTDFPEHLRIRFAGGVTYDALRRWSAGNRLGVEFVSSRMDDEESLRLLAAVRQALKTKGVHAAIRMMQEADFLKNDELRDAAAAAETALARLSALLE